MDQNDVAVAFDIVLEGIENAIEALNQEGAQAFKSGKYEAAKDLMEKGSSMILFRGKISDLQKEWLNIFATVVQKQFRRKKKRSKQAIERLKRGLRTPEDSFRVPILLAIVDLGGSAAMGDVLDKVELMMKTKLNAYDCQPLSSEPAQMRWRNTAQWSRNSMIKEGLMSADSPRGIWEITQEGRKWIAIATKS